MRSRFATAVLLLLCLATLGKGRAAAHFGPAEAPDFGNPECITVIDAREQSELLLSYVLGYDDTEPELGHIFLPDSKTHSFFAFRGAVVADLPRYRYLPFGGEPSLELPLWIDRDDVMRAEANYNPSDVPDFHPETIVDADYLRVRTDLAEQWLEVSREPARVPITLEQAARGVVWDVSGVAPGVYQVAGYVFSPPYNAWEPRPGLIKIIDGEHDAPAVVLDSIDGMIFAGQGRRITGCVDAPAGSTLTASFRVDGEPDDSWREWSTAATVASGVVDLCFQSPDPGLAGLVRMRVTVTAPDGTRMVAYSKDALALFGSEASCTQSATLCCPAKGMEAQSNMQSMPDAGMPPSQGVQATDAAGARAPLPAVQHDDPDQAPRVSSGGCSLAPIARSDRAGVVLIAAALALARRRTRRKH